MACGTNAQPRDATLLQIDTIAMSIESIATFVERSGRSLISTARADARIAGERSAMRRSRPSSAPFAGVDSTERCGYEPAGGYPVLALWPFLRGVIALLSHGTPRVRRVSTFC
jgi:hypothetical protein